MVGVRLVNAREVQAPMADYPSTVTGTESAPCVAGSASGPSSG
jgi:hypothetical protein